MSSRLSRRALFALPVALPVAVVAGRVAPGLANPPKPRAVGPVVAEELHIMWAGEWRETGAVSANVARKLADLEPFDAAFKEEMSELRLALADWRSKKSCGGVEGHAAKGAPKPVENYGAQAVLAHVVPSREIGPQEKRLVTALNVPAAGVEPCPQDTIQIIGLDASGNDDMVAVAIVKPARPVVA